MSYRPVLFKSMKTALPSTVQSIGKENTGSKKAKLPKQSSSKLSAAHKYDSVTRDSTVRKTSEINTKFESIGTQRSDRQPTYNLSSVNSRLSGNSVRKKSVLKEAKPRPSRDIESVTRSSQKNVGKAKGSDTLLREHGVTSTDLKQPSATPSLKTNTSVVLHGQTYKPNYSPGGKPTDSTLPPTPSAENLPKTNNKKRWLWVGLVVLIIVVLLAAVIGIVFALLDKGTADDDRNSNDGEAGGEGGGAAGEEDGGADGEDGGGADNEDDGTPTKSPADGESTGTNDSGGGPVNVKSTLPHVASTNAVETTTSVTTTIAPPPPEPLTCANQYCCKWEPETDCKPADHKAGTCPVGCLEWVEDLNDCTDLSRFHWPCANYCEKWYLSQDLNLWYYDMGCQKCNIAVSCVFM